MRDCPKCGTMVDGVQCGRCGYREPTAVADDPDRITITYAGGVTVSVSRCCNMEHGLRCAKPGTLSSSTHPSKDTQWYCADHYPPFVTRRLGRDQAALPLEQMRSLREIVKPKLLDPEAMLERQAIQGEQPSTETDTRAPA